MNKTPLKQITEKNTEMWQQPKTKQGYLASSKQINNSVAKEMAWSSFRHKFIFVFQRFCVHVCKT